MCCFQQLERVNATSMVHKNAKYLGQYNLNLFEGHELKSKSVVMPYEYSQTCL